MLNKNKQSPTTLYLLNAKNSTQRQQQERKSARLTFNKKKSSRSISQYQKWNPSQNKDSNNTNNYNNNLNVNHYNNANINNQQGQIYHPQSSSRTSSQIKKIVFSKNQFGLEPMKVEQKLASIIGIFQPQNNTKLQQNSKRVSTMGCQSRNDKLLSKRSQQAVRSGQISLLSLKQMNEKQRHNNKSTHSKSKLSSNHNNHHRRTQSMLNHADQQRKSTIKHTQSSKCLSIDKIFNKIQDRFKLYQKYSQDWKLKYSLEQTDYLIDDLLKVFKGVFNELTYNFTTYMKNSLTLYENSIVEIVKDYECEIAMLKDEISKKDSVDCVMDSLVRQVNQKHCKAQICSKIFQDIQSNGTNLEQYIKQSTVYPQIMKLTQQLVEQKGIAFEKTHQVYDLQDSSAIIFANCNKDTSQKMMAHSDDEHFYQEEKNDYVEQDSNWDEHFLNRESIKGVLKYIHNHKENKSQQNKLLEKQSSKTNLNSTGYLLSGKNNKTDMKIDNWKSFQDKSISQYKKIKSQR